MKKINRFCFFLIFSFTGISPLVAQKSSATDSTGVPGDNFSLQGAIEMFKKANSPEEFEKLINTQDNNVNNLDLNDDGEVDYIRVIDKPGKNVHAFVLQVLVSEKESQDVAVIELEKTGDATAILQIVGDEDIFGEEVIVEPFEAENVIDDKKGRGPYYDAGSDFTSVNERYFVVNVWLWPSVRFVYRPGYVVWISPWKWRSYPVWWHPWRPLAWHIYHPRRVHYNSGCVVVKTHRVVYAHSIYKPYRTTSVIVTNRHRASVTIYRKSRTTIIKPKPLPRKKVKVIKKKRG